MDCAILEFDSAIFFVRLTLSYDHYIYYFLAALLECIGSLSVLD